MTHNHYIYIAVMALVSYAIRILPLTLIRKPIKNPLEIFFRPRRFADHHDRAARSAVREHGAGPRFTETAAVAVREKRLQLIPGTVCHLAEELH